MSQAECEPQIEENDYLFAPERHETDRFLVRSYQVGDGELLAEAVNDSYEHFRPWLPWAVPYQGARETEKLVRQFRARYLLAEDFALGVFSPDEQRLLGGSGFHLREGGLSTASAEIGMFIRQSEAGKGLGTRLLREVLRWGFQVWPWQRLAWCCDEENLGSVRVAEKSGMRREGVLRGQPAPVGKGRRNTACYGITRDEWLENQ